MFPLEGAIHATGPGRAENFDTNFQSLLLKILQMNIVIYTELPLTQDFFFLEYHPEVSRDTTRDIKKIQK